MIGLLNGNNAHTIKRYERLIENFSKIFCHFYKKPFFVVQKILGHFRY